MEHRSLAPNLVIPTDGNACRNQLAGEPASDVASGELLEKKQMGRAENCSDLELSNYLQALAEGCLVTYYSDTKPSALSKSISIASRSYRQGRQTVHFHGFPSLEMSRYSTGIRGEELLTWYLAASRVKTSALPEAGPDWTAKGQGYGEKWLGLLGRFDHVSCSLKTAQLSLLADLTESSPTLPRWGLMLDGELYPQPIPALITSGNESGFWPTPNTEGFRSDGELLMLSKKAESHQEYLAMSDRACNSKREKFWPTPQAPDNRLDYSVERESFQPGQTTPPMRLNPEWVEVLMGWPNEMTSLNPISSVKMCFWLMGFCDDEKTGRTQVLRVLREGNAAKEIRAAIGRPVCISEAAFLLHELCEYANRPYEARIFMACAETLEGEMRSVRLHEGITGAPHRPGQGAQRPEKHTDSMQALSRLLAHHGQEAWENGSWEDGIPRVVNGMANRAHRIKCLGNGQVPRVRAAAWSLLYGN